MASFDIQLIMPADVGALVVSRPVVRTLIENQPVVRVIPQQPQAKSSLAHHDFGATALAIVGTGLGAAAVKGVFDIINAVVKELFAMYRQKNTKQPEKATPIVVIKINAEEHEIDLRRELAEIQFQLRALSAKTETAGV